nr:SDR family oxidoreductase [uncultured Dongia sp.]
MKTVLIIGGAGTFGARILRLLADTGQFRLLIGGRDLARAELVRASLPNTAVDCRRFDRNDDAVTQLTALALWAVIDAAGPFQDETRTRYRIPEACIALGIHYIDLADSRSFVTGIAALDRAARSAGVTVISGASSVPALSHAIVAALAQGLDHVAEIDIALSASNRATAGPSVNTAILSYVGQAIRLRRAGAWAVAYGWQCLARKSFAVAGHRPINNRWVGLCDVPDLDLLPQRFPTITTVIFRAGAELAVQNLVLWLTSFAVRWGWLRSLRPLAPFLTTLQRLGGMLGTDRSAMSVSVSGRNHDGRSAQHLWTLIAEDGHGPWVPSFAATLLLQKLAAGELSPGATPAAGLLTLEAFAPLFARFHLFTETRRTMLPPSLYARVLGNDFRRMPVPVQSLHALITTTEVSGRGRVERGHDPIARLIGWLFRFPPAQEDVPVTVRFTIGAAGETWQRDFAGHRFRSRLASRRLGDRIILTETFWPLTFDFDLTGHERALEMKVKGWRVFGLPLPRKLAPQVSAGERAEGDRFTFDVRIALPWGSLIVHYRGFLEGPHQVAQNST